MRIVYGINEHTMSVLQLDTATLLLAIKAKHDNNATDLVEKIIQSTSPRKAKDVDLVLYEGQLCEDGPSLRKALIKDIPNVPGVKRENITDLLENGIIRREIGEEEASRLKTIAGELPHAGPVH